MTRRFLIYGIHKDDTAYLVCLAPSESPQNVTLEKVNGGTSLIVRWEPPPREQQNGILTGYKIRYKQPDQRDRRRGEIITTDGNRRSHTIENLKKGEVYMVKIAALTVNGTGPATDWISTDSYRAEPEGKLVS